MKPTFVRIAILSPILLAALSLGGCAAPTASSDDDTTEPRAAGSESQEDDTGKTASASSIGPSDGALASVLAHRASTADG